MKVIIEMKDNIEDNKKDDNIIELIKENENYYLVFKKYNFKALAYIGKNSIVVLCVHFFFIKPVVKIFGGQVTGVYLFLLSYIVVIVLCIVSISFLLKCCPFIIGKEKVCKECV